MRILLTGANGQLGNALQKLLGASCIPTDFDTLDITKPISFDKPVDCIINCAAYTNVDRAEDDAENAYALNALGAKHLTQFAKQINVPLLHISTDYVFDGTKNIPYVETDEINPKSVYGKTKAQGEAFVREYEKHFIVRTAWLYGKTGKNFVKTITRLAQTKPQIQVVSDQIGCPTNAEDLAKAVIKLIKTKAYGTYHCTGSGRCSWFDFACEIVRLQNLDCAVNPCTSAQFPQKANRPGYSVLNNSKLEQVIGCKMPNWQHSLQTFLEECDTNAD